MDAETKALLQGIQHELAELKALFTIQFESAAEPIYNIKQAAALAGVSRNGLIKLWERGGLNIPEPRLKNGLRPMYSLKDINAIKLALKRRRV